MIIQANEKEAVIAAATQHPSLSVKGGGSKTALAGNAPVVLGLGSSNPVSSKEKT